VQEAMMQTPEEPSRLGPELGADILKRSGDQELTEAFRTRVDIPWGTRSE